MMILSLKRNFKTLSILSLFNPSLQLINGLVSVSLPLLLPSSFDRGSQNLFWRKKNKESCLRDTSERISLFDGPAFDGSTPSSIGNNNNSTKSSIMIEDDGVSTGTYTPQKKIFYKSSKLRQSTLPNSKKNCYDGNHHLSSQTNTDATIRSCLRPLIQMMRPGNFPGVILFHVRKYIYYLKKKLANE
jgi:hypothetical protein